MFLTVADFLIRTSRNCLVWGTSDKSTPDPPNRSTGIFHLWSHWRVYTWLRFFIAWPCYVRFCLVHVRNRQEWGFCRHADTRGMKEKPSEEECMSIFAVIAPFIGFSHPRLPYAPRTHIATMSGFHHFSEFRSSKIYVSDSVNGEHVCFCCILFFVKDSFWTVQLVPARVLLLYCWPR